MEKNCLITSFKGKATGELPYYGAIHFSVRKRDVTEPTKEVLYVRISNSIGSKFIISGDGHFTDETLTENLGKEITITRKSERVYFSLGDYEMYLIARYSYNISIDNIDTRTSNGLITLHIDDLKYIENGIEIRVRNNKGNIESLMGKTNLNFVDLKTSNNDLYGDFSKLGNMKTNKENCYFIISNSSGIFGEIIDFIDNHIKIGDTKNFNIWLGNNNITYNGARAAGKQYKITNITETSFQITYGDTTDTWSKASGKWVLQQ